MKKNQNKIDPGSFRDPSGFVFYKNDTVYRQVNDSYRENLELLESSGLLDKLQDLKYLVGHEKITANKLSNGVFAQYKVQKIPFISYPYEWSFSQLKDAALLTLKIQKLALQHGMTLKDASAYNIQFLQGKPIFIDSLSFEKYSEGKPWVAYQQFCQHFVAPLLLMSKVDLSLGKLLATNIDGIPLPLTSKLLPKSTHLSFPILTHIHLHAKNQKSYSSTQEDKKQTVHLSRFALLGIIDSLESLIKKTEFPRQETEWGEYYTFTNYSESAFKKKGELITQMIRRVDPKVVWDVGANNGEFSRFASDLEIATVSSDYDPVAVEKNYRQVKKTGEKYILPLLIDLTNPSPAIGWDNQERKSFLQRGPADLVLALALIHHMAISNNVPFARLSDFFAEIGENLIIEFVPKSDSQVKKLLLTREDVFNDYSQKSFETQFGKLFTIIQKENIPNTKRTLYLLKRK